jgi:hypothetical protein
MHDLRLLTSGFKGIPIDSHADTKERQMFEKFPIKPVWVEILEYEMAQMMALTYVHRTIGSSFRQIHREVGVWMESLEFTERSAINQAEPQM